MMKNVPILHVDGSMSEYIDKKGILHKVAGLGGYLVVEGRILDKFFFQLKDTPYLNRHEDYAIIEGLKWVREKGFRHIKVKSDSQPSVHLFTNQKRSLNKIDKFFLLQYFAIEFSFDGIELLYHNRSDDDMSHLLSRTYLKDLPRDVTRLHCDNNKKKKEYEILADAGQKCELEINQIVQRNLKRLLGMS